MDPSANFLAAIDADPRDDARRLIYADWLDEHDNPAAAEFLRAELEVANFSPSPADCWKLLHASGVDEMDRERPSRRLLRSARALRAEVGVDDPTAALAEMAARRERLWRAWAGVDRRWLHELTQPHRVRAYPVPYRPMCTSHNWIAQRAGYEMPPLDAWWDSVRYSLLPSLPLDVLRGEFQYLRPDWPPPRDRIAHDAERAEAVARLLAVAHSLGFVVPPEFVRFIEGAYTEELGSFMATERFFRFPNNDSPMFVDFFDGCLHIPVWFSVDSNNRYFVCVHRSGAHCMLRHDHYSPRVAPTVPQQRPFMQRVFQAPSFESYLFREWLEFSVNQNGEWPRPEGSQTWADKTLRDVYIAHYRRLRPAD